MAGSDDSFPFKMVPKKSGDKLGENVRRKNQQHFPLTIPGASCGGIPMDPCKVREDVGIFRWKLVKV